MKLFFVFLFHFSRRADNSYEKRGEDEWSPIIIVLIIILMLMIMLMTVTNGIANSYHYHSK